MPILRDYSQATAAESVAGLKVLEITTGALQKIRVHVLSACNSSTAQLYILLFYRSAKGYNVKLYGAQQANNVNIPVALPNIPDIVTDKVSAWIIGALDTLDSCELYLAYDVLEGKKR